MEECVNLQQRCGMMAQLSIQVLTLVTFAQVLQVNNNEVP